MYYGYNAAQQPVSGMAKLLAVAPIVIGIAAKMYEAFCDAQAENAKHFSNGRAYNINHYTETGPDGKTTYVYVLNDGTVLRSATPFTIEYGRR